MTKVAVVEEVPWRIELNGALTIEGTFRPGSARELATGRLFTEGFLGSAADVLHLVESHTPTGSVRIEVVTTDESFSLGMADREHRTRSGCGLMHYVVCEPERLRQRRDSAPPDAAALGSQFRTLFEAADAESAVGGVHAAALSDGDAPVIIHVDTGRHNTVDKVLGEALLQGRSLGGCGLLLTARISGEIAQKAARAGVAWVSSRSLPTTLAVAIARAAALPLIPRAGREGTTQ